jgi:hypothetical protein
MFMGIRVYVFDALALTKKNFDLYGQRETPFFVILYNRLLIEIMRCLILEIIFNSYHILIF